MAVMDACVSVIVRAANQIDLRVWQLRGIESMGKRHICMLGV